MSLEILIGDLKAGLEQLIRDGVRERVHAMLNAAEMGGAPPKRKGKKPGPKPKAKVAQAAPVKKGKRRFFTEDYKREIVASAAKVPKEGTTKWLAEMDIPPNLFYSWRREYA